MARLQDLNTNLNPNYSDGIEIENDLYAFIDESGDEGFDFTKSGVSKWFNVSAFICKPQVAVLMVQRIEEYRNKRLPQRPIERMDSKELKHNQKQDVFISLSSFKFITTHSLFYKPKIDPKDNLVTYPSMYFVGVKNVLERISWCTNQYKKRRTHIIISNRNNIKAEDMQNYLFHNSVVANKNLTYQNRLGLVKLSNFNQKPQLLLADYSAFSLRKVFEEEGDPPSISPYYFDMFQKGKLFSSTHKKWRGIWGCGLKITPSDKSLIKHSGILNEGTP